MSAGGVRGAKLLAADCSPGAETESRIIGPLASPVDAERRERVRDAFVQVCIPLEGASRCETGKLFVGQLYAYFMEIFA